jgi:hypothetical protein
MSRKAGRIELMNHCGRTNSRGFDRPVDLSCEIVTESFKRFPNYRALKLPASIDRSCDGVPLLWNVFVSQTILIPALTDRTFKAAVVDSFLPGQSYQRSGIAIGKETTPINLNQKNFAWDKH